VHPVTDLDGTSDMRYHNDITRLMFCATAGTTAELERCIPRLHVSVARLKKKLRGLSPQANYTDRATAAVGEVVPTFAGRGCYVVSPTDSHGR
jgi:hypothetical protein